MRVSRHGRNLVVCVLLGACGQPPASVDAAPTSEPRADDAPTAKETVEPAAVAEVSPTDNAIAATRAVVILVPLKSFPESLLDTVEASLVAEYDVQVRRHAVEPLPKAAYYSPRRRYRADTLLEHLETFAADEPKTTRVLGLTEVDISTTKGEYKDWGVFGLGYSPGQAAVVSSFRLRRKATAERLEARVQNVALHEIGHTFGLPHCTESGCLMLDAEGGIENTDTSTGHLGSACTAKLEQLAPLGR